MVNLSASEAIFRITSDATDDIKIGLDLLDDDVASHLLTLCLPFLPGTGIECTAQPPVFV